MENEISHVDRLIQRGKYDEAREHLVIALENQPDDPQLQKFTKMLVRLPQNGYDPDGHLLSDNQIQEIRQQAEAKAQSERRLLFMVIRGVLILLTVIIIQIIDHLKHP
jgi:uncharacterized protein HemY